jgi:hypothetical protein
MSSDKAGTSARKPVKRPHRIDGIALALVLATCTTWWLGEGGLGAASQTIALAVLALAAFKGVLISLDFMELRHAPALWRRAVLGWLGAMVGLIGVASLVLTR